MPLYSEADCTHNNVLAGVCLNHVQHVDEEPKQEPQAKKLKAANATPDVSKAEPPRELLLQLLQKQSASSSARVDLGAVAFDPYFNSEEDDADATAPNASSSSAKKGATKRRKNTPKPETGPKSGTAKPQAATQPSAAKGGGQGKSAKSRPSTIKEEPAN